MVRIEDAVIVVAHPDDEVLWFSSIFTRCKSVLVCFGPSATSTEIWDVGRAALMENYPLAKVRFLKLRQSDAYESADWSNPIETQSGLELRRSTTFYVDNASKMYKMLESELEGQRCVFAHNPWGEYGNEEHVQVFRTVSRLQREHGFDLFVSSYVSNRSAKLMSRSINLLGKNPLFYKTDVVLARQIKDLYLEYKCWTWMPDYEWPDCEMFYRIDGRPEPISISSNTTASPPLNYIDHHFHESRLRRFAKKAMPDPVKYYLRSALSRG